MIELAKQEMNEFTVKLVDCFVNKEANEDPSRLDTVFLVMEYYEYSLDKIL